jgi:hypothetical protein
MTPLCPSSPRCGFSDGSGRLDPFKALLVLHFVYLRGQRPLPPSPGSRDRSKVSAASLKPEHHVRRRQQRRNSAGIVRRTLTAHEMRTGRRFRRTGVSPCEVYSVLTKLLYV